MADILSLNNEFSGCACGRGHFSPVKKVAIGSGVAKESGGYLTAAGFGKRLLLVADENTLRAAHGVEGSLGGFTVTRQIYKNLRAAEMQEVKKIEALLTECDGVLSVGTGSLHDICRLAAARAGKPLALLATAASMDGFASDCAPITDGCFKITYPAKAPEVIIADTKILAAAPAELKSAGFGDMMGKYTGLIDWQASHIVSGEYYCPKVAGLSKKAADDILKLSGSVLSTDESAAGAVFEALLLTGVGMSFTNNSRPASGTEHILSHFWECKKLLGGELSDYHGKKVGVATLLVMREYERLAARETVRAKKEQPDWQEIYNAYGALAEDVKRVNATSVTAGISPQHLEESWQKIRGIVKNAPPASQLAAALERAGCPLTAAGIGVSEQLAELGMRYHPYMRGRLSLMRLRPMIKD